MKVVIIGGTGHVGTYLVPRLVMAEHEVVVISRQKREPYIGHSAWSSVERIVIDRKASEEMGIFGDQILGMHPDVVIDMICYTPESAVHLVEKLRGKVKHLITCGTIWVHGHSEVVPTSENQPRRPFGEYGIRKAAIESWLLSAARETGFPVTILHPGHIVGRGWPPVNPAGNFNMEVFKLLAEGKELLLPNLGMETLHHVHADDVAQAFVKAMENRNRAVGESFHIVSPQALTLRGYAQAVARWYGKEVRLRFLPWEEWKTTVSEQDALATWDHIAHSPNCSIEKARRLLGYEPRYTSLEAVYEAVGTGAWR